MGKRMCEKKSMKKTGQNSKFSKKNIFQKLFKRFYPTYRFEKVEDIPYTLLEQENIKLILFDMDNTLVNKEYRYSDALKAWTQQVKQNGIQLYILSNSPMGKKVEKVAKALGMEYHFNASKPSVKGFQKVVAEANQEREHILMVGDQLFTDVWGGNRFGVKTVLVKPIGKKEWIGTKAKRPFEKIVLKEYEQSGKEDET